MSSAAQPAAMKAPLPDSLRRLLAESVDIGHGRLELLVFELGDERARLGLLMQRGAVVAISGFLAAQTLLLLAVALSWDSQWRLPVVSGMAALMLIVVGWALHRFQAIPESTLFEISRREFALDRQGLERR